MPHPMLLGDFATLFSYGWHRDFPVDARHRLSTEGAADWTIHTGLVVRACADLMGLYCVFEQGKRHDALLRDREHRVLAALEWEWQEKKGVPVDELAKLNARTYPNAEFMGLLTYVRQDAAMAAVTKAASCWTNNAPLLFIVVEFTGRMRVFKDMALHRIERGKKAEVLRRQPALPWEVPHSRWFVPESK
jgi:hypothetical protein